MPRFRVTLNYSVSQSIDVDADSQDEAIDLAFDKLDTPNVSNKFEQDGEPDVIAVYDETGEQIYPAHLD